jgi:homoserine kinase
MSHMINLRVPATSANLGPGFDCLGLAIDLWNEVSFEPAEKIVYQVTGEGEEKFNKNPRNLLTKAYMRLHEVCGKRLQGTIIRAHNHILVSSGLGSSAAAIVTGLVGANEFLGKPMNEKELLKLANEIEGHPDNVAPALLGGLVVSIISGNEIITRQYTIPELTIVIVKPNVEWSTRVARAVLPRSVSRADAIFNIGRAALVVDALQKGDLDLLQKVMEDRIHQSHRLKQISGGFAAYKTAKQFGAAALSGAGPSIIVFTTPENAEKAIMEISSVFEEREIKVKRLITKPSNLGIHRIY